VLLYFYPLCVDKLVELGFSAFDRVVSCAALRGCVKGEWTSICEEVNYLQTGL